LFSLSFDFLLSSRLQCFHAIAAPCQLSSAFLSRLPIATRRYFFDADDIDAIDIYQPDAGFDCR